MDGCEICALQQRMEAGTEPWTVARLRTGYVALAPLQYYRGYVYFSHLRCVRELHDLSANERAEHLHEMAEVAHAVERAFTPRKLNLESLGNGVPHLHWHIVPRHEDDPFPNGPIWENHDYLRRLWIGEVEPDAALREDLRRRLLEELQLSDVAIERSFVAPEARSPRRRSSTTR
jgi:diadenosine tetraphosphate (Ap4A) HIT family hydrolase